MEKWDTVTLHMLVDGEAENWTRRKVRLYPLWTTPTGLYLPGKVNVHILSNTPRTGEQNHEHMRGSTDSNYSFVPLASIGSWSFSYCRIESVKREDYSFTSFTLFRSLNAFLRLKANS